MKVFTRFLSLVLCIFTLTALLPTTVSADNHVNYIDVTVDEPKLGQKPATTAKLSEDCLSSEFVSVEWYGSFDENGCFKAGQLYRVILTFKIKDGLDKIFGSLGTDYLTVNGKNLYNSAHYRTLEDSKQLKIYYDFPFVLDENGKKVSISYISKGTLTVAEPKIGAKPADAKDCLINSSTVYINGLTWSGELDANGCFKAGVEYTAKFDLRIPDDLQKFFRVRLRNSDFTVNGQTAKVTSYLNVPKQVHVSYTFPIMEDPAYTAAKITEIKTFYFNINMNDKTVKPSTTFDDNLTKDYDKYTVKISYDKPDLEPYAWHTATVTYKAKDGHFFTKDTTFSQPAVRTSVEEVSRTDDTIVLKYTTYTSYGYSGIAPTEAMKNFVERRVRSDIYKSSDSEIALGKIINPDDKTTVAIYKYPTYNSTRLETIESYLKYDIDGLISLRDISIAEDIPDMEGEWYFVREGFIPACFVEIVGKGMFEGAPAEEKDSPFIFDGGSGTYEDPYLISTAAQLDAIRYGLDYHYKLTKDIDLSKWGNWVPIGGNPAYGGYAGDKYNDAQRGVNYFGGSLDGDGHVISGMQIVIDEEKPFLMEDGNTRYYGLFAHFSNGVDTYTGPRSVSDPDSQFGKSGIRNLGLVNYTIDVHYTKAKNMHIWVGAFAGMLSNSVIHNCYATGGSITFNIGDTDSREGISFNFGGLVGELIGSDMRKCYNTSELNVNVNYITYICTGGLVGISRQSWITECFNTGNITLPVGTYNTFWRSSYASGILGESVPASINDVGKGVKGNTRIRNCYNTGHLTANYVNGIFAFANSSECHIENCYNIGKLTCETTIEASGIVKSFGITDANLGCCYVSNCYTNGNSVSGSAWRSSGTFGRMILKSIPESEVKIIKIKTENPFTDVKSGDYFEKPVLWALKKNITTGTTATTFSPNSTCTRAQILTFLWRAVGSPKIEIENPFKDVSASDYYYGAALWAYQNGMVTGTKFEGNTPCTRAATVVYLWKNAGSPTDDDTILIFQDVPADAEYTDAVKWAFNHAITSGTTLLTFSPDATCTRGQIATFLYRAVVG